MTVHQGTRPISRDEALAFNPNWNVDDRHFIESEIERLGVDGFLLPRAQAYVNLMRGGTRVACVTTGRVIYQPSVSAPGHSEPLQWESRYRYLAVRLSTALDGVPRPVGSRGGSHSPEAPPRVCPSCFLTLTPAGSCPSDCED